MKSFKILAFDGGGIKGVLSAEILYRISLEFPNFLDEVDLIAGTSTGSIIAGLLAKGTTPKEVRNLYNMEMAKQIFSSPRLNLFRPKFSNKNLKSVISKHFNEDLKLKDLKKKILIPAFNINGNDTSSWNPVFFNNFTEDDTSDITLRDAVISSSSAPTYFPSYKGYIDGSVVANSPTAISIFYVLSTYSTICDIKNIKLLSIGTGDIPEKIYGPNKNWGVIQWAFNPLNKMKSPILSLLMDGMSELEDKYCREFLKSNYFRINPKIFKFIDMSEYKFMPYLSSIGASYDLSSLFNFIDNTYLK